MNNLIVLTFKSKDPSLMQRAINEKILNECTFEISKDINMLP
jgi:hypothetical protein